MNPVPWLYRPLGAWRSLKGQTNAKAYQQQLPTYDTEPESYRFEGWGVVFDPYPQLACNVKYFRADGQIFDFGRIVS